MSLSTSGAHEFHCSWDRDRVFYFGSHVIHAAALQILKNSEIVLMKMNDLEDIVVFLNGERAEAT